VQDNFESPFAYSTFQRLILGLRLVKTLRKLNVKFVGGMILSVLLKLSKIE
jgi:hypothetical protein